MKTNFLKIVLLFLFLGAFSHVALSQDNYENTETGEKYNERSLERAKEKILKSYEKSFPEKGTTVKLAIQDTIIRNEQEIVRFTWDIDSAQPFEKVYEYVGKKLPDYQFTNLKNEEVRLEDYQGKPVFIELWFSRCRPCIAKHPELNKLKEAYEGRINFVAIGLDDAATIEKTIEKFPLDFIHLVDARLFTQEIGQVVYPKTILLDANGKVTYINDSLTPVTDVEIKAELDKLLKP